MTAKEKQLLESISNRIDRMVEKAGTGKSVNYQSPKEKKLWNQLNGIIKNHVRRA